MNPQYEWVLGPIKTHDQEETKFVIDGPRETWGYVGTGIISCVIYGQIRNLATGHIINWAKKATPETAPAQLAEAITMFRRATDWSEKYRQTNLPDDYEPGKGEFEDGIICQRRTQPIIS